MSERCNETAAARRELARRLARALVVYRRRTRQPRPADNPTAAKEARKASCR